jgi:hypothetical protein
MTRPEILFRFFKRLWICGSILSIVSIFFFFAALFGMNYYLMSRSGLQTHSDTRMSIDELWMWQLYLLNASVELCFTGAIFAVTGATMCLMRRLKRKPTSN